MSRASRRPRHRRDDRTRAGAAAGRASAVLVLGAVLAAGLGGAAPTGTQPAAATTEGRAGAGEPVGGRTAEQARWSARSAADAHAVVAEARTIGAAALAAASGVEPLRVAPEPPAALADLDGAVVRLRDAVVDVDDAAAADPGERVDAARAAQDAAAEVFRLALEVEASVPPVAVEARGADLAGLDALEAALLRAEAAADRLSAGAAGTTGPGTARRAGTRAQDGVTSGPLRADGTVDPAVLCPVPFAPGARLRCDAVDALVALNAEFRADHGTDLPVGSTYRTYAEQVALKIAKGGLAAHPGTSHHGWGVAVDFSGFGGVGEFDGPLYRWMVAHGPAYGWIHPAAMGPGGSGPPEPWHWEYAGPARG